MTNNKDKDYEQLAQAIYQEILDFEGYSTISVQHDVRIQGKSGVKHQIDVYWEFEHAQQSLKVAVECKNHSRPISLGKVRDFTSVLDDIGNVQGIFVSRLGFQSGAREFAAHHGIALKELREPEQDELKGMGPAEVNIAGHARMIENIRRNIVIDFDWVISNTSIKEGEAVPIDGVSNEILIIEGPKVRSIHDFENSLSRYTGKPIDNYHKYEFENGFLTWPKSPHPPLKVTALEFFYDINVYTHTSKLTIQYEAKDVLKDVFSGELMYFNRNIEIESKET